MDISEYQSQSDPNWTADGLFCRVHSFRCYHRSHRLGYGLILLVFSPVDTPKRIPHHYAPGRHRFPINHPSHVSTRRDG
ncbi:hypothetical protein CGCA056_v001198 [Colletotrichum aenigma]|uniref:uncharacterized protein n=1 Tax=Colletotrichum aenigma TaxID=1215731 RepID=UPI001872A4C5|nr:uncharacterized protein CGCA056_v001198 [Colletotrichum aenigma]KAF5526704.1 hypothetical protein CGCA056_v001198 [Colletotrichum aenigma]